MVCHSGYAQKFTYPIVIGSGLSIVCSFFIIYLTFKKIFEKLTMRLVYQLAVNDILRSFCLLLCIYLPDDISRTVLSSIYIFSILSNIYWTLYLSVTLFLSMVQKKRNQDFYYKYWLFFNYFVLLGLFGLPYMSDGYGYQDYVCTLKLDSGTLWWRISLVYAPATIITIIDTILYGLIYRVARKEGSYSCNKLVFEKGFIYVVIILVQIGPMIVIATMAIESDSCAIQMMQNCNHVIFALHGVVNGVAILSKGQVRESIRKVIYSKDYRSLSNLESSLDILNTCEYDSEDPFA